MASKCGDAYSYVVLILEMFTKKRPTDSMFHNGMNLHPFAKVTLPNQVKDVIDHFLVREIEELHVGRNFSSTKKRSVEESMVSTIEVRVICSSESPMD